MSTKDLEGIWEAHARHDSLSATLSDPGKKTVVGGSSGSQLSSHPRPDAELLVRAVPRRGVPGGIPGVEEWPAPRHPRHPRRARSPVVNASSHAWHPIALGQVNLGNRWFAQDGIMEREDDARAGLPKTIKPGKQTEILRDDDARAVPHIRHPAQGGAGNPGEEPS